MIYNSHSLLDAAPIKNMLRTKEKSNGVSHGLAECGYDIRIKQSVRFIPGSDGRMLVQVQDGDNITEQWGRFTIASSIEEFQMPPFLVGVVHDKSTWARKGLSVFNTVLEASWEGFLTLELVYHGNEPLFIPAGSGIAQILFSELSEPAYYSGKYQGQVDKPVEAIFEK